MEAQEVKTNATQRSLKYLREQGWTVCIVEKFLPARGTMKFPRRIDAYGFGDILACNPAKLNEGYDSYIALVQSCPGASHAEHKTKILAIPEFQIWKAAGGRVLLMSWAKQGPRGKRKAWTVREEEL
jgi:hypothetical protein